MKEEVNKLAEEIKKKYGSIHRFAISIGIDVNEVYRSFAKIRMNRGKYVTKFDSRKELERWRELVK